MSLGKTRILKCLGVSVIAPATGSNCARKHFRFHDRPRHNDVFIGGHSRAFYHPLLSETRKCVYTPHTREHVHSRERKYARAYIDILNYVGDVGPGDASATTHREIANGIL